MWSHLLFAASLLAASGILLGSHARGWRACRDDKLDRGEFDFRRRQFRRRFQASGLMGIVGLAILAGLLITNPLLTAILWLVVLLLVAWMLLLAIADMQSSYAYYHQLRAKHAAEHASLQDELNRLRQPDENGRAHK